MFRSFFSTPAESCISLLLSASVLGVTIAKTIVVDDGDTDRIAYSQGWIQCPEHPACPPKLGQVQPHNGTWHGPGIWEHGVALSFDFTFNGTSVEAWFIGACTDLTWTTVHYSIDQQGHEISRTQCNETEDTQSTPLFQVQRLVNQEHTLKVDLPHATNLSFDYLIYEEADPIDLTTSVVASVGTSAPHSESPTTPLGPLVGGIVSGVALLTLAIVGVLWYRFKNNSRNANPEGPLPSPPSESMTMVSMSYDPPGYTEKNAYFGIASNYSSMGPTAEKGQVDP